MRNFFCILALIPVLCFSQFNTLTPVKIKKEETTNPFEKEREQEQNIIESKEKSVKKKGKRTSSKNEMKREIDSLKMMMLKYSFKKNNENSLNFKKIEDSVLKIVKNNLHNPQSNFPIKKFDLLEENVNINSLSKIFMPLNNKLQITSNYGGRTHPIFGGYKMHNGIDFAASYEHVYSVLDGIVTASGWDSNGGGNYIKVSHSGRFETAYLHLSDIYYKVGEKVKAGWIIGKSGNSGNSTGPHLHFSVKEYGNFINPMVFLNDLIKVNNLIAIYNGK